MSSAAVEDDGVNPSGVTEQFCRLVSAHLSPSRLRTLSLYMEPASATPSRLKWFSEMVNVEELFTVLPAATSLLRRQPLSPPEGAALQTLFPQLRALTIFSPTSEQLDDLYLVLEERLTSDSGNTNSICELSIRRWTYPDVRSIERFKTIIQQVGHLPD